MTAALVAVVTAALAYGVSTVLQAAGARRARGLGTLAQPLVVAGLAIDTVAWLLTLVALESLPLFVVQSIQAASVVVVVLLARLVLDAPLRSQDVAAVAVVVAALVVVAAGSGEQPAVAPPAGFAAATIGAGGLLCLVTLVAYRKGSPALLAALAGLGYSTAAVAARGAHAADTPLETVLQPLAVAVVLGGAVGVVAYLRALERGTAGAAASIVSVVEVVVPGVVGVAVLGDTVRPGWQLAVVVAVVASVAGCAVLSTAPAATLTEDGTPHADDASAGRAR